MFSKFSAACCCIFCVIWLYLSKVIWIEEWPKRSWTILMRIIICRNNILLYLKYSAWHYSTDSRSISKMSISFCSNKSSSLVEPFCWANKYSFSDIGTASNHATFLSGKSIVCNWSSHRNGGTKTYVSFHC